MGCGQSKIDHEEAVTRCKERKEFMKKAVSSRNAFAAAHSGYTVSLRNTGAALSDYGQGEVQHIIPPPSSSSSAHHHQPPSSSSSASASIPSSSSTILQPPIDTPLPPPPPLPDFTPPLQRAASMPDLPIPKKHPASKPPADDAIREEDDVDDDGDADDEDEDADAADDSRIEHRRRRHSNRNDGDVRPPPTSVSPAPAPQPVPVDTSSSGKAAGGAPVWLSDYFFDTESIPVPSLSQPEPEPVDAPSVQATTTTVIKDSVSGGARRDDNDSDIREIPQEKVVTEPPLPPPQNQQLPKQVKKQKAAHHQHAASAGGDTKRGRMVTHTGPRVDLLQVLNELDDHFLKASESAHEVSKMLEATRMHYHSNFADNRGHIDHSARVMRVITWNRSCKGMKDENDKNDDFDNEESETHATILDKMLAWEKKLYDEVKAGELMKLEYQRKVASLKKQKKRGASPETLEKTKAAVSHLHTRYIVDMQSMDSTVSEINRLRDKQLYPKLVELVDGMVKMWETMHVHHNNQFKIVADLRNLDISLAPKETSEQHHERTHQLWRVLQEWRSHFQNLMKHQKEYIQALNDWLKLNLIPIESNLKEKVSSPPRVIRPAIQPLLHDWHDFLEKLPDDRARSVIHTFEEVVHTIFIIQEDELKLKDKCEDMRREFLRKSRAFEDWKQKYLEKKAAAASAAAAAAAEEDPAVVVDLESRETAIENDEIVAERKAVVQNLEMRLKTEEESYQRICKQVREKSIGSLKTHLPELFRAMSDFSLDCSEMYKKLKSITTEPEDTVEAN